MTSTPSVTACLTTFNAAAFLRETLETLAEQTWGNLIIKVSDDCSSDKTWQILEETAARYPGRLELHRQAKRLGWVGNTNSLLEQVDTDLFFLCYHDDHLAPQYVEKLATALLQNPGAAGAFCDLDRRFSDSALNTITCFDTIDGEKDAVTRGERIIRREGLAWIANRGVFRRTALDVVGGLRYNLEGEFAAAYPWITGLALEGELIRVQETLCIKYHLESGASHGWQHNNRTRLAMMIDMVETVWRSSLDASQKKALLGTVLDEAGKYRAQMPG